jgi:uncharacterized protein YebE (UPF0316 family)
VVYTDAAPAVEPGGRRRKDGNPLMRSIDPMVTTFIVIPLLIFLARLIDVSIGTVRIIMLNRGRRLIAPALGFVEVLIWLLAIREIFQHLDNVIAFFAYAAGFAGGTMVGMMIEEKLAIGTVAVRAITTEDARDLMARLSAADFGVTSFGAEGVKGNVRLIFIIVRRRELPQALEIIRNLHPHAFITVSDVRTVSEGVFPEHRVRFSFPRLRK